MFDILVVEDDVNTRKLMTAVLKANGYMPICASNGVEALQIMDEKHVDLVLLDVMMPKMDGFEFTKILRENNCNLPILMVTAKETSEDKKHGFRLGIDDYMIKPVDEEEMILRIAALLRRSKIATEKQIVIGDTILSFESFTVKVKEDTYTLPQKEFLLLFTLLSYPNKIFTRRSLMDEIWDLTSESDERTVDVHINRLREKFGNSEDFEIKTLRGLGYKAVMKNGK